MQEMESLAQVKEMRRTGAIFGKKQIEMEERVRKIDDVNRWRNFRMNKSHFVNIYLDQKRRQAMVKGLLDSFF